MRNPVSPIRVAFAFSRPRNCLRGPWSPRPRRTAEAGAGGGGRGEDKGFGAAGMDWGRGGGKGKKTEACKWLPSQLFQLPLPPTRAGRCNIPPPLHLSYHYLSPHPPHAHIPPTSSRSLACKREVGRSRGGGGGLRVSNLVLINKPTCAAAAAATHPTIPDISPAPLRRKKRLPPPASHPTHPQGPLFLHPVCQSAPPLRCRGTNGLRE